MAGIADVYVGERKLFTPRMKHQLFTACAAQVAEPGKAIATTSV